MNNFTIFWHRLIFDPDKTVKSDIAILILRVVFGSTMMINHGWGKLIGYSARAGEFSDPLGVGSPVSLALTVFAEFFCSLGLIFGITTRLALIPLMVTMFVAAFIIHISDPFARMENALIYLAVYITIMVTGPGKYSFDAFIASRLPQK